jgi:peroxidase
MHRIGHSVRRRAVRRLLKKFSFQSADVLEERQLLSASSVLPAGAVEPIGGTGNNVAHSTWGAAGNNLIRLTPAQYANGYSSPSLSQDPSARVVSNLVNSQADPANPSQDIATVNKQSLSDFVYSFGQFMDHDMDLTQGNGAADNISVPLGDPIGGPNDTPLSFNRSQTDPATGTGPGNPAQQVNSISSYFDLSQIYGSDVATDNALRTFVGGQMKTSPGGLPPLDNSTYFTTTQLAAINASVGGMANDGPALQSQMFVTGDSRGNENVELTVLQALFLDNHNRLAAELQKQNPTWTDQQLFNEARKLNIAQYQSIIYNEWIPAVLGSNALPAYKGYNPNVDASIANEFSTVAFRFGHSLLSGDIERQGNNGQPAAASVPLEEDFFDPTILNGEGLASTTDPYTGLATTDIGAVLKGDADGDANAEDVQAINEIRNDLFNEVVPGVGYGQDLIALDVQRGRDNGIGSYNEVRQSLGLPAVTSFAQITSNVTVQKELQAAYGNVNNIDAFEGGLAEDPVAGSDVGPLFQTIMVNQFTRLRDGDRFFYLNETFTPAEQALLNQGNTLAKVIEANTNITNLQSNVFIFQASIGGTVSMNAGKHAVGVPDITVQLEDANGNVLATTSTNRNGQYSFNQQSGPAANVENPSGVSGTGTYRIVLSMPSWLQQTGPSHGSIAITRGGQNVTGVNFNIGINWNGLATTTGGTTAADNLANLVSATPVQSTGTAVTNAATTAAATTNVSSGSAVPASADTMMSSTTASKSGELTPESLVAYFESLGRAATTGAESSANSSGSPPATEWSVDSAFAPAEFAKIVDQLS